MQLLCILVALNPIIPADKNLPAIWLVSSGQKQVYQQNGWSSEMDRVFKSSKCDAYLAQSDRLFGSLKLVFIKVLGLDII